VGKEESSTGLLNHEREEREEKRREEKGREEKKPRKTRNTRKEEEKRREKTTKDTKGRREKRRNLKIQEGPKIMKEKNDEAWKRENWKAIFYFFVCFVFFVVDFFSYNQD
jgi:hypothetical protein